MKDIELLYNSLRKIQEPKGYFFNRDRQLVMELLTALFANRKRYGFMACPCRLASEDREANRDIVCPCAYREADVAEYGSCYCGLYVSQAWNDDIIAHAYVPERRPVEKMGL
jgi:ferredoxin-thioredoxin reductase catalytic subunit